MNKRVLLNEAMYFKELKIKVLFAILALLSFCSIGGADKDRSDKSVAKFFKLVCINYNNY